MKTGLFLGRFQPFHLGHLGVIEDAVSRVDQLKIVIGSSQESGTQNNPFDKGIRLKLIRLVLSKKEYYDQLEFFFAEDINCDEKYAEHICKIAGDFDTVFAADNPLTEKLFSDAGFDVVTHDRINGYASTEIRDRIRNSGDWKIMVPEEVADFMESSGSINLIRSQLRR